MESDNKPNIKKTGEISPEQVADFLRNNPTFFRNRDDLLVEMRLHHESGKAISLLERQVTVLRERNMDMRHRLTKLLETARDNDKLFDKTKRLVLALLETQCIDDVVEAVIESLQNDFQVDACCLTLFGDPAAYDGRVARIVATKDARTQIGSMMKNTNAVCGILRKEELSFLFGKEYREIGSAAVAPLSYGGPIGILAIGSYNPQYYRSSMGTLFLSYIAEVLNRLLPQFIQKELM